MGEEPRSREECVFKYCPHFGLRACIYACQSPRTSKATPTDSKEYVSVYELLGAKIDDLERKLEEERARVAILVSRALATEAKLNITHKFTPFDNIPERCKFCGNSEESHA